MNNLTDKEVLKNFMNFKNILKENDDRYASFDYCYSYFYSFYRGNNLKAIADKNNIHISCLQLGMYLASWGMYRGSTVLIKKNVLFFKPLIKKISMMNKKYWEIDICNYNENEKLLLECKGIISRTLKNNMFMDKEPSETLITKIMLGVFANTPAFDQYFKNSSGLSKLSKKSIQQLYILCDNKIYQNILQEKIKTKKIGSIPQCYYTEAKKIDMIFFTKGLNQKTK